MAVKNLETVKEELVLFARKNLTDPNSRGSDATETFDGDDSTTQFTVANNTIKHITTLTVDDVAQVEYTDFTVEYTGANAGRITFTNAPASGTDNISVTYHYGDTWVFPHHPKNPLKLTNYPVCIIDMVADRSRDFDLGTNPSTITDFMIEFAVYSHDTREVDNLINAFRTAIHNNSNNLVNLGHITLSSRGPMDMISDRNATVVARTQTFIAPLVVET